MGKGSHLHRSSERRLGFPCGTRGCSECHHRRLRRYLSFGERKIFVRRDAFRPEPRYHRCSKGSGLHGKSKECERNRFHRFGRRQARPHDLCVRRCGSVCRQSENPFRLPNFHRSHPHFWKACFIRSSIRCIGFSRALASD